MRLSKFLSIIIFITSFCLLYVYQQTEIFRLAYVGQKRQAHFEDLLDKNSILRYNINKNGSLSRIGSIIAKRPDFEMPDTYQLVRLAASSGSLKPKERPTGRETVISRLFGIKDEAEAKTINPY